jgi:hypothetical protein
MYTRKGKEGNKKEWKDTHTHTQNQPVDPPIRGLFSTRDAHDQFPGNQWGYFFFGYDGGCVI